MRQKSIFAVSIFLPYYGNSPFRPEAVLQAGQLVLQGWLLRLRLGPRCGGVQGLHGERNAPGFQIDAQHLRLDDLPDLHHVAGLLHVAVGQFAHVHQPILMNAHIHERAEAGDVGDHAFEHHAGLEVGEVLDVVAPVRGHELVARVAAGLPQFLADVAQRVNADTFGGELLQLHLLDERGFGDQAGHGDAQRGGDLLHHRVRLGVDRGHVERLIAAANAQEAGGLLERLGAEAGDGAQIEARTETAVLIAVLHDLQSGALGDAGHVTQQRPRSRVEVHAHAVHAAFDGGFQALLEAALIHVVLVLADADGLGVHLDELGQRVLEAAGNGDGAADGEVEIGELLAGQVGGRVDGRAGFADGDAEDAGEASIAEEAGHEGRRLARGGSIADGDGLHIVARHERGQGLARAGFIVARLERVDHGMFQELAGIVDYGDLAAGADARVERQDCHAAGGRREQEIFQVFAEDLDGLLVGAILEFQADLGLDGGIEQAIVGVRDGAFQVRGPVAGHTQDLRGQPGERAGGRDLDLEGQHALIGDRGGWRASGGTGSWRPARCSRCTA